MPEKMIVKRGRPPGPEPTCTVKEAAKALVMSHWTIRDWLEELCSDGKPVLPYRKIGNRIRIPVKYVDNVEARLALRLGPRRPFSFSQPHSQQGVE